MSAGAFFYAVPRLFLSVKPLTVIIPNATNAKPTIADNPTSSPRKIPLSSTPKTGIRKLNTDTLPTELYFKALFHNKKPAADKKDK